MIDVKTIRKDSIVGIIQWNGKEDTLPETVTVTGYLDGKVYFKREDNTFDKRPVNNIVGIPLDEDWLVTFGFEKIYEQRAPFERVHFENKNCWVYIGSYGFELELITLHERHNLCRQYQYVHQLQNLHYALTGQELTCKPK